MPSSVHDPLFKADTAFFLYVMELNEKCTFFCFVLFFGVCGGGGGWLH